MLVRSPWAFQEAMGTGDEGVCGSYEGFSDSLFENGVSGGRGKEGGHCEGCQVDFGQYP